MNRRKKRIEETQNETIIAHFPEREVGDEEKNIIICSSFVEKRGRGERDTKEKWAGLLECDKYLSGCVQGGRRKSIFLKKNIEKKSNRYIKI